MNDYCYEKLSNEVISYAISNDLASETDVKKLKSLKSSEKENHETKNYPKTSKKKLLRRKNKFLQQNECFYNTSEEIIDSTLKHWKKVELFEKAHWNQRQVVEITEKSFFFEILLETL